MSGQDGIAIIDAVYAAASEPDEWPAAITALADYLGALGGMLVRNAREPDTSTCVIGRLAPDISARYLQEYTDNPWTRAAATVPVGEVAILGRLYDLREGRKLAWYADVIQPSHTADMTFLALPGFTSASSVGGLAFCHSETGQRTIDRAAHRLRALTPHLTRAVWLSQQVETSRNLKQRLDFMVDSSPRPVLLLSASGRVVDMNSATETFLRTSNAYEVDAGGRLRSKSSIDDDALQAAISYAAAPTGEQSHAPMIVHANGSAAAPLRLLLSPLPRMRALPALAPETHACVLVMIIDPRADAKAKVESLSMIYGLTAGEARVAGLLATGMGRDEAASRLHVSVETVKKHTAACFTKVGVHSQAGLAHVVASLPAL